MNSKLLRDKYDGNRTCFPNVQVTWLVVAEVWSETSGWLQSTVTITHVIFFIVECGIACFLCAMRECNIRTSSASPRLPLCQISFLTTSVAGLAHGEKSRIQLINCTLTRLAYLMQRGLKLFFWNIPQSWAHLGVHNQHATSKQRIFNSAQKVDSKKL